jgi:hypothetical protein
MKNFNDALSHRQKRTCARFLRNAIANSPITTANTVDCHRWFVNSPIISSHLSYRAS